MGGITYKNISFTFLGVSFFFSAIMYAVSVIFNDAVNPFAIVALGCNCVSWFMTGLSDNDLNSFDKFVLISYVAVIVFLGIWFLLHVTKPVIPAPLTRISTSLLGILSILNGVRYFKKIKSDKPPQNGRVLERSED